MERTGISLMLHEYTGYNVDLAREVFEIKKENKVVPLYRPDNKKPYYKFAMKDWGYVIGHITVFCPVLTGALMLAAKIKR